MSEFKNVTAVKKANVYFDGKVSSRVIILPNGEKKNFRINVARRIYFFY